jgi:hypothetical protein
MKQMKGIRKSRLLALLSVSGILAFSPAIGANTKAKPKEVPARVIAHIPLPTASGSQMVLQRGDNKQYLYIQAASKQGYTIVEVTKPEFPSIVNPSAGSKDTPTGKLDIVGADVGISQVPNGDAKTTIRSGDNPTETVKILDLSDPAHPKVLQTFNNVTSMLPDGGRGLIYLTNNEGLWVLKYTREERAGAKKMRPCTAGDAIASMPPDCQ